jgi:hypothetical protein
MKYIGILVAATKSHYSAKSSGCLDPAPQKGRIDLPYDWLGAELKAPTSSCESSSKFKTALPNSF